MTEIDAIFASKGKAKLEQSPIPSSSLQSGPKKKKRRNRNKVPSTNDPGQESKATQDNTAEKSSKNRPAPETVVDSFAPLPSIKRQREDIRSQDVTLKTKFRERIGAEEDKFNDSRGSKIRRTTEEGWKIYKENELGIGKEGGDTPLCPFDCNCCF